MAGVLTDHVPQQDVQIPFTAPPTGVMVAGGQDDFNS